MIKLFDPHFTGGDLKAVEWVFQSGVLTHGDEVVAFEKEFAEYVGSKYAVAVNSCTSALFLSLQYHKKQGGNLRYVGIPSVTFASVAAIIEHAGLFPVFEDNIYVGKHYYLKGTPVIDSAHELHRNCYVSKGLMCFSFYPTKILGGLEGGMIATDNKEAAEWLKLARSNGLKRDSHFGWDYKVEFAGWKMNMNNVQAAVLRHRLKFNDMYNQKKELFRNYYNRRLGLQNTSNHVYPVLVANRKILMHRLDKAEIQYTVNFSPLHKQPAWSDKNIDLILKQSEYWGENEISIPFHENLILPDVEKVCEIIAPYVLK